jgi:thiosulfate reductase cytochrome b subunit
MHRTQRLAAAGWLLAAFLLVWLVATAMTTGLGVGDVPHITVPHVTVGFGGS